MSSDLGFLGSQLFVPCMIQFSAMSFFSASFPSQMYLLVHREQRLKIKTLTLPHLSYFRLSFLLFFSDHSPSLPFIRKSLDKATS